MTNADYRQHACDRGLNMTWADAAPPCMAIGATVAHDIADPGRDQGTLIYAGTTLTPALAMWLKSFGVDYVTFRI